jgi:hypothetical protein
VATARLPENSLIVLGECGAWEQQDCRKDHRYGMCFHKSSICFQLLLLATVEYLVVIQKNNLLKEVYR